MFLHAIVNWMRDMLCTAYYRHKEFLVTLFNLKPEITDEELREHLKISLPGGLAAHLNSKKRTPKKWLTEVDLLVLSHILGLRIVVLGAEMKHDLKCVGPTGQWLALELPTAVTNTLEQTMPWNAPITILRVPSGAHSCMSFSSPLALNHPELRHEHVRDKNHFLGSVKIPSGASSAGGRNTLYRGLPNPDSLCFQNTSLIALLSITEVTDRIRHMHASLPPRIALTRQPILSSDSTTYNPSTADVIHCLYLTQRYLTVQRATHSPQTQVLITRKLTACLHTFMSAGRHTDFLAPGGQDDMQVFCSTLQSAADAEMRHIVKQLSDQETMRNQIEQHVRDPRQSVPALTQPAAVSVALPSSSTVGTTTSRSSLYRNHGVRTTTDARLSNLSAMHAEPLHMNIPNLSSLFVLHFTLRTGCDNPIDHCRRNTNKREEAQEHELLLRVPAARGPASLSMQTLIDERFAKGFLDAEKSPLDCCDQRKLQWSQNSIQSSDWPQVLCIVLVKFLELSGEMGRRYVDCPVHLDASSWNGPQYSLHAVCNHSRALSGVKNQGHYVCNIRDSVSDSWTRYDDANVQRMPLGTSVLDVLTPETYMLVYTQYRGPMQNSPAATMEESGATHVHSPTNSLPRATGPGTTRNFSQAAAAAAAPVTTTIETGAGMTGLHNVMHTAVTSMSNSNPTHHLYQSSSYARMCNDSNVAMACPTNCARGTNRNNRRIHARANIGTALKSRTLVRRTRRTLTSVKWMRLHSSGLGAPLDRSSVTAPASPRKLAAQYMQLKARGLSKATRRLKWADAVQEQNLEGLRRWADRRLEPNVPSDKLLRSHSTAGNVDRKPNRLERFASLISTSQTLAQSLRMTDWHSQWQGLFPPWTLEAEFPNTRFQQRSDTLHNGWRCEFETQIPTVQKVTQREALCSHSLVWILNLTAAKYRSSLRPPEHVQLPTPDNIGHAYNLKMNKPSGLHCDQGDSTPAACRHYISASTLQAHHGLRAINGVLFLDLGFCDVLWQVHTPIPAGVAKTRRIAVSDGDLSPSQPQDLSLSGPEPIKRDETLVAPGTQSLSLAVWTVDCVGWRTFLDRYADQKHFQRVWGDGQACFLGQRSQEDTCHRWFKLRDQDLALSIHPGGNCKSYQTQLQQHATARANTIANTDRMHNAPTDVHQMNMKHLSEPKFATSTRAVPDLSHDHESDSGTLVLHDKSRPAATADPVLVPKNELIRHGIKILLSAPSHIVGLFNIQLHHRLRVAKDPVSTALINATRAAFGEPTATKAPRLTYKKDQVSINRMKLQVQMLDQAARASTAVQRKFLTSTVLWKTHILRDFPALRLQAASASEVISNIHAPTDNVLKQHQAATYQSVLVKWRHQLKEHHSNIAARLNTLEEHRRCLDRANLADRMNSLFQSRMSYVIQCIFNPRDESPVTPPLEDQIEYFSKRFECLYFGDSLHAPLVAGKSLDPVDTHARSQSSVSTFSKTSLASNAVDLQQVETAQDVCVQCPARTTLIAGSQFWSLEHTRSQSFTTASCAPSGAPDLPDLTKSSWHNTTTERTRHARVAKQATIGTYSDLTRDLEIYDLQPAWAPKAKCKPSIARSVSDTKYIHQGESKGLTQGLRSSRRIANQPDKSVQVDDITNEFQGNWSSDEEEQAFKLPSRLRSDERNPKQLQGLAHGTAQFHHTCVPDVTAKLLDLDKPYQTPWSLLPASMLATLDTIAKSKDSHPGTNVHYTAVPHSHLAKIWGTSVAAGTSAPSPESDQLQLQQTIVRLGSKSAAVQRLKFAGMPALPRGTAIIVTDGSCSKQQSTGGYAAIILMSPEDATVRRHCRNHQTCAACSSSRLTGTATTLASDLNPNCTLTKSVPAGPGAAKTSCAASDSDTDALDVTIVCGGHLHTTSGVMELMAVYRATHYIHEHFPEIHSLYLLTDYMALVQCKWSLGHLTDWRGHENTYLWERLYAMFSHFQAVQAKHVRAHSDESRIKWTWQMHMNDQADALAASAREAVEKGRVAQSAIPSTVLPLPQGWTDQHARALFLAPICIDELKAALKSININSAPGPDGIPIRIFRHFDEANLLLLLEILEDARKAAKVPTDWKQSRVTLIYKLKGLATLVANWRPITVQKCITLLFTKIFARRLLRIMWHLRVLPMTQKCNVQNISGVNEHSFLLRAILEDMHTKARLGVEATVIALLTDVNKAFDSIQRGTLLDVLRELLGDVEPFVRLIGDLYDHVSIILTDSEGNATEMPKRGGIHQGDAMSAILYILVTEFSRREYEGNAVTSRVGYVFLGDQHREFSCTKMDYEDDDTQFFSSMEEARNILASMIAALRKVFLSLNAGKCTVMALRTVPATKQLQGFDPELEIDGIRLKWVPINMSITSLGLTICPDGDTKDGMMAALSKFFKALRQLDLSSLLVAKKLYLLRTVVSAKIEYEFTNMFFPAENLDNMDRTLRQTVRRWLKADGFKINNAFLYASCQDGGLGLPCYRDRFEIKYMSAFAHMVCAHDPVVRNAAWSVVHTSQIGLTWPAKVNCARSHGVVRARLLSSQTRQIAEEAANPPFFAWARLPSTRDACNTVDGAPSEKLEIRMSRSSSAPTPTLSGNSPAGNARMAMQYARLAQKLGVGFAVPGWSHPTAIRGSEQSSTPTAQTTNDANAPVLQCVSITLNSEVIDGPFKLAIMLKQRQQRHYRDALQQYAVLDGKIEKHQGISHIPVLGTVRFTRLYLSMQLNCYTDDEVGVILKAQLDLWPTASKLRLLNTRKNAAVTVAAEAEVEAKSTESILCTHCKQVPETVSHLLTIPQNGSQIDPAITALYSNSQCNKPNAPRDSHDYICRSQPRVTGQHPEPLASHATNRHNRLVRALVSDLQDLELYTVIIMEKEVVTDAYGSVPKEADGSRVRNGEMPAQDIRQLMCPPNTIEHSKPDVILIFEKESNSKDACKRKQYHCIIVDIVCTADEHALCEQEIGFQQLRQSRIRKKFHDSGIIKDAHSNHGMLSISDHGTGTKSVRCYYSPTASKFNKYAPYARYVKDQLGYASCEIFPLIFGARGFVPSATSHLISKLVGPTATGKLNNSIGRNILSHLLHVIFRAILVIYKTWQALPRNG